MNLLQKQGFYNSLILYSGTALGFFNLMILFQRYLSSEEIGFFLLMGTISTLYAQFSSLGISNIILRFFPYYSTHDKKHGGFVTFVCLFSLISFIVFTLGFIILRNPLLEVYKDKHGFLLLKKYYYYLIPVSFFALFYNLLESLGRTVFKNILSAFLREVFLKLFTCIGILLIALQLFPFDGFIMFYICGNGLIVLILWYSIYKGDHFNLPEISTQVKSRRNEMVNYGLFAVLSGGSFAMIQNIDTLALSAITTQSLTYVAIYGTFFSIAVVVNLPAKALNRTSYQIISNAWKDQDMEKIRKIYHKTSVVQSLIGCLLVVGLIINKDHILYLLYKPEYASHFNVFIIIAFAFLVDITGGLNSHIISSSKYYKIITYILIAGVFLCSVLNIILIPQFGMSGAAISYLATVSLLNFTYWLFIKVKFNLQPFGEAHIKIIVISLLCFVIGLYLPSFINYYVDVIYRSVIVTAVYTFLIYYFNVSEDIKGLINKIFHKVRPAG